MELFNEKLDEIVDQVEKKTHKKVVRLIYKLTDLI